MALHSRKEREAIMREIRQHRGDARQALVREMRLLDGDRDEDLGLPLSAPVIIVRFPASRPDPLQLSSP